MAESAGTISSTGLGQIDVATEVQIFFAHSAQKAAESLKTSIDQAKTDSAEAKRVEENNKQVQQRLDTLLKNLPDDQKPGNIEELKKILREMGANKQLSEDQRKQADTLLAEFNKLQSGGEFKNQSLADSDWKQFQNLVQRYQPNVGPVSENSRGQVMSWISLYTGKSQGRSWIGKPGNDPKASAEDIDFINDIKGYLNERAPAENPPVDWKKMNGDLRALLPSHFDTKKETTVVEDEQVRLMSLQMGLQNWNNAISGASNTAKAAHDTEKGIIDKM